MSPVGDRLKYAQIHYEVVGESPTQRVLVSRKNPFLGYNHDTIADSLAVLIQDGDVVSVVAPDHSGTAMGLAVVQNIRNRRSTL